ELTNSNGFFLDRTDTKQIFSLYEATGYNESGISGIGHIESLTLAQPLVSKEKPDMYVTKDSIGSIFTDLKDTRFGIDTTATKTSSSSSDVLAGGSSTGNTQYTSNYFTNYNGDLPIFSKIKVIGDGSTTTNLDVFGSSIVLDRLEEIVLLDAEAMAVLNQNENAISLLNQVKANRGVSLYSGEGGNPLIKEIFQERRRELMGEGWRWFDLVRYNKIVRDNPAFNKLIDEGGIYWPVAQTTLSGEITQNTYWQ
ncbi:RagB/SusD family nutrient uptake outer membrane protein, partial [Arachidicoccus sp.]|uniref:RagB/SusD family nutrient uptake outer membrane protein n=1 Tax=Arachidicoccus sp. TaxID=1872624 RepID=UPI003D1E574D